MARFFSFPLLIISFLFLQSPARIYSWKNLDFLDLGSNKLEGPLPPSLCKMDSLKYLLLSDNQLSGTIPDCLGNMSMQLTVLDLRRNRFVGKIPTNFPKGNTLRNLGLNGNQLEGTLPRSILNCTSLEVLDVGHNNIEGPFPTWLETLPELSVLILKWNQFNGPIGISSNKPFQKLRILDISHNNFNGTVPTNMIDAFVAMKKDNNDNDTTAKYMGDSTYYQDSVTLLIKGLEVELKRVLTIFTTIDLSENKFEGRIPESIGELDSLRILNLSRNSFDGLIPPTIGDLSALESLDFSFNNLSGKIPPEMESLNFLSFLNLSMNNLTGRIPTGMQFYTFNGSSYLGNPGLCGAPLEECGKSQVGSQPPSSNRNHEDLVDGLTWESVVIGFGCGLILGIFVGSLMLFTHKPRWFYEIVRDTCDQPKRRRIQGLNWSKMSRAN